ncbi:co-chaperone GroES [Wolinella succinogenes]|uniref:Co-chaperonin GroES n=1 Tax=Wolinella succinogenes (strain ATCC 29543 / DSM 1740 / CCUG 13145 / JCM 31913 / LMG 7466 / NCTC 11488 / FDC 602W) TaxID=273121 RepID=CH10_WOLSU|nr:co-chaperone GroES [Wolinella succinogenes]Q7MAE2.1 RecName: Full=Co-chaperonin GroES; AltName: Full=10 kDa chaperonin; AltName: Full=Chaperonin-10; Short=Cpn10 [Wolinella succinogenes DSM 1740]HCZ19884.1 co-chaperone GroES [Helicobacter sp.]NLU35060.1 co-chaperone GroES [Wolinella succinogenes]CAE09460.1 HEAT SHOCK PROTEIN GROES [Wolinella succinogenes]VEG81673.1 co-chaperonin GroES [Wolinella succinogenes]
MNFKPLGQRVLVERLEEDTKTASGIIIPDNAKEKPLMGTVKALSEEVAKEGLLKAGSQVVFAKYSGTDVKLEGKEYLILKVEDLLGTIE